MAEGTIRSLYDQIAEQEKGIAKLKEQLEKKEEYSAYLLEQIAYLKSELNKPWWKKIFEMLWNEPRTF